MLNSRTRVILWAQWRSTRNRFPRANQVGVAFTGIMGLIWYGLFGYLSVIAAYLLSSPSELPSLGGAIPGALLLCFLYWQFIPVLTASMGSSLDIRKLLVYPVPRGSLFWIEVALRVSTSIEMLMLLIGAGVGLALNPSVPIWAPAVLIPFVAINLLLSAGVRDLLIRLLARKRIREIVVFLLVLCAALPQALLLNGPRGRLRQIFSGEPAPYWPWNATAELATGKFSWFSVVTLLLWVAVVYFFSRWQFERGLNFDRSEASAVGRSSSRGAALLEWWYRLPSVILRDPLGALVEKELRFLTRTPRFRLVFTMGFSFGLLIWLPMAFGRNASRHSLLADNYLTLVSVYALLILSDALFWNCFGFDRGAVQLYLLSPVKFGVVLVGKNVAAAFFVALEISAIALVCALLRLPLTGIQVLEAIVVSFVVMLFILSIGNLSSLYNPRSVDPSKSFRTAASARTQAMLMLAFPLALIPVALAYLARYAFDSEWAFFGALLGGGVLGGIVYSYSLGSAVRASEQRREDIITALSRGDGPIAS